MLNVVKPLNFAELRIANVERCEKHFHKCSDWTLTDWGCATAGEVGEACNLIKKLRRGDKIDINEIGKELADIVTYVDHIANALNLDLGECVRAKFNEVSDRVNSPIKL
jgi:NTP pyrophosphatase (non-canonical NTP hydrolase)